MLSGFALAAFDGRPCVLSSCRAPGDEEAQVENLITANGTCHGLPPRGREEVGVLVWLRCQVLWPS